MTIDRLQTRRTLLEQLDDRRREIDAAPAVRSLDRFRSLASSIVPKSAARTMTAPISQPLYLKYWARPTESPSPRANTSAGCTDRLIRYGEVPQQIIGLTSITTSAGL